MLMLQLKNTIVFKCNFHELTFYHELYEQYFISYKKIYFKIIYSSDNYGILQILSTIYIQNI